MAQKVSEQSANYIIEGQLDDRIGDLEDNLSASVLTYIGAIGYGSEDLVRHAVEEIDRKKNRLVVILETTGGYIDPVERIVGILRHHFKRVDFIIPNFAMSAGTVLVMSGDSIMMDYHSVLGPIDPQVLRQDGSGWIPATGYLIQFERLIEKSRNGELTTAEMALLLNRFDPAELYHYEQAREHSILLLKQWLVKFKFKDWRKTRTKGKKVTPTMRRERAEEIASILSDTDHWHSHSRGITMEVLRKDLNLEIDDFGENAELQEKVRTYYILLKDYMMRRSHFGILHAGGHYEPFIF